MKHIIKVQNFENLSDIRPLMAMDNDGNLLYKCQSNDEIWYTVTEDYEGDIPHNSTAFYGANGQQLTLLSNQFEASKKRYVMKFNGDVTTIGEEAFSGCTELATIELPDSVTSIGDQAFNSCISLKAIIIPDKVTTVGNYAFNYCYRANKLVLGRGLKTISQSAFYECADTNVVVPDGVTTIGYRAFGHMSNLINITIPASVTSLDAMALFHYSSQSFNEPLSTITVAGHVYHYTGTETITVTLGNGSSVTLRIWTHVNF